MKVFKIYRVLKERIFLLDNLICNVNQNRINNQALSANTKFTA